MLDFVMQIKRKPLEYPTIHSIHFYDCMTLISRQNKAITLENQFIVRNWIRLAVSLSITVQLGYCAFYVESLF